MGPLGVSFLDPDGSIGLDPAADRPLADWPYRWGVAIDGEMLHVALPTRPPEGRRFGWTARNSRPEPGYMSVVDSVPP
ncbi:MAG TPA: hypothetical protein VF164_09930 [Trueperaceae bacterium]